MQNKIIISTPTIKSLLTHVARLIPKKSPNIPILGFLLFEVVERTLHITSTDLKTFMTVSTKSFDCNHGTAFLGCAKATTILEHINNLDDEPLVMEFCPDFSVKVRSSDGEATFEGENPGHFPRQPKL